MNILVLTKNVEFHPAKDIAKYLISDGHYVEIASVKPPFDLPPEEFGDEWDLGVSVHYNHILRQETLDKFRYGVINIHPSMLPYGRGADPCIWSLYDDLPLGITIHWMDKGIDTGNILFQLPIEAEATETGESLYERSIGYYKSIFSIFWSDFSKKLKMGNVPAGKRQLYIDSGTDENTITAKRSDLPIQVDGGTELGKLMALHHSKYNNAYMMDEFGNKYWVKLHLEKDTSNASNTN